MKRMLGLVLALAVMVGMSMPSFAQDKKAAPAAEKKEGKEGEAKKSETAKKNEKKGEKKSDKKDEKKDEKKSDKK